jgi:AmmeMemoRadiSam system protein B
MYYFDNQDFFPKSVAAFEKVQPLSPSPRIFIVNQHILAAHLIARQFALAADPKVKTVVLITQNNWNAGRASIITSRYDWKTAFGDIKPNLSLANSLIHQKLATPEEQIFTTEHGITGIVPYIAHSFPNATIVPLVIHDGVPENLTDALANQLSKLDLSETAIVGSIDMSHYLPTSIANLHDAVTIQTIQQFDYKTLPTLDIDTVPTLRTLLKLAEKVNQKNFVVTGHINSAHIVGDPNLAVTTSYITGYFTQSDQTITTETDILFVGGDVQKKPSNERIFLGTHGVIASSTLTKNTETIETQNKKIVVTKTKLDSTTAHDAINRGADIVVGLGIGKYVEPEIYKNKAIFYSLGEHSLNVEWKATSTTFVTADLGSDIITTNSFTLIHNY